MKLFGSLGLVVLTLGWNVSALAAEGVFDWKVLPPLPDSEGFAGVYGGLVTGESGVANLVVAGGANFPAGRPWDGGKKVYSDGFFRLELGEGGTWSRGENWLEQVAYGMSVSLPDGSCLFMGGKRMDDAQGRELALSSVSRVRIVAGKIVVEKGPELPLALVEGVAGVVGDTVIVLAGAANGEGNFTTAQRGFVLDSAAPFGEWNWKELAWPEASPGVPARGRMYATAGVQGGRFYLFGGRDFADPAVADEEAPERVFGLDFLRDCYSCDVEAGSWERVADLPQGMSAAPATAAPVGATHLMILGGVNVPFLKEQVAARPETQGAGTAHPGFPSTILGYDTLTDTWVEAGEMPTEMLPDHETNPAASRWAPVTTPLVFWDGGFLIPTGEIKPGIRSPQVLAGKVAGAKAQFGWLNWVVVVVYLLGMVGVGYWFMLRKAAASTEAYFRGGQHVPWWVAGLSIFATMLSSLTFMGIPARAYQTDVTWYIGQLPILIVVPLVVFCYLPFFRKLDLTSAYEYLERRFNLATRLFASVSFILFHIGRIAIVLYLPALALAAVSDIGVIPAILIIGVLCVIYTVMGGIEAVVWTDAIQALVLMGGAILCFGLVLMRVEGGIGTVYEIANADNKLFENLRWDNFDIADGTATAVVLFVAFLFNSLVPYTSGQDVVQRYVTTPDIGAARKSLWTTMWMSVFGSLVFFGLGAAIYAFYKTHPVALDPTLPKTDSILPFFVMQQLPVGVSGLIIAAIFAASQSTISSSLNSVATAWVKDFDTRLLRPGASDAAYLSAAKWVVVVVGFVGIVVACIMALSDIESAFKTFNKLIGLTAGALGGLFALGVFTRSANGRGAMVGAVVGFATVLGLYFSKSPVSGLLYAFIGFAVCFLVGYVVSLFSGGADGKGKGLSVHG